MKFTQDSTEIGIRAGDTGVVTSVTPHEIRVFLDIGKSVQVPLKDYQSIELGYALTHDQARALQPRRAAASRTSDIAGRRLRSEKLSATNFARRSSSSAAFLSVR